MSGERTIYVDPAGREAEIVEDDGAQVRISVFAYTVVNPDGTSEVIQESEWTGPVADFHCGWRPK